MFYFDSFAEFLAMGKHGAYVWTCFAITVSVLLLNLVLPWLARKRLVAQEIRRLRWEEECSESGS